jgi:hypothetical protein
MPALSMVRVAGKLANTISREATGLRSLTAATGDRCIRPL